MTTFETLYNEPNDRETLLKEIERLRVKVAALEKMNNEMRVTADKVFTDREQCKRMYAETKRMLDVVTNALEYITNNC